jgi:DNA-binding transcriptional MerR regulator
MPSPDTEERREVLTLPEIAKRVGVEYRTLNSWVKRGLLAPSIRPEKGIGRPGLWSNQDAARAVLLGALRRRGLDMPGIEAVAAELDRDVIWTCPVCLVNHEFEESSNA